MKAFFTSYFRNTGILAIILAAVLMVPSCAYQRIHSETVAQVTEKERMCSGQGQECKWMVLTDQTSFQNADSLFNFKFSSTDLQGKLKEGHTYTFTHYGWRVPFLSMYPNIIEAVEVNETDI